MNALPAKILVIGKYGYSHFGGIEESSRLISEGLAKKHTVRMLVFGDKSARYVDPVSGVELVTHRTNMVVSSQPISIAFAISIFKGEWDVVYFHAPNVFACFFLLVRIFLRKKRFKLIVFHHMDMFGRPLLVNFARYLYNKLIKRADRLIATSRKNQLYSKDISEEVELAVIPLGVEPSIYQLTPEEQDAAKEWRRSIAGAAPVVGFVGRHARYKGLDILIRSLAQLPNVHAFIAGDGPETDRNIKLSNALGVQDRVHFLGTVTHADKCKILAAIDVFAFPSTEVTEAFGISQVEAMIAGVPVVASNLPTGVTDVAVAGESAWLVEPHDVDGLASALNYVIFNPEKAKSISDRAYDRALDRYTLNYMVSENIKVVDEILGASLIQEIQC